MKVLTDQSGSLVVCRPIGDLDAYSVSQFRQALANLAAAHCLVFDLSGVGFIDSAGLGALIAGIRRVREHSGDAAVVCPRPTLTRLLRTIGFDHIVSIVASTEEARLQLLSPCGV